MKVPRKILRPTYYDRFQCIGGACEDTCCKDWTIFIDKRTYMDYRNVKDKEFAAQLPERVRRIRGPLASPVHYAEIRLREDNKHCHYYTEDGMCGIQLMLGHKYLSLTCQVYPRQSLVVLEDFLELSLTVTCPEAARVALLQPEPISFVVDEQRPDLSAPVYRSIKTIASDLTPIVVWDTREGCIDLLQCQSASLAERIFAVSMLLKRATELMEDGKGALVASAAKTYLQAVQEGEFSGRLDTFPDSEELRQHMESFLVRFIMAHCVEGQRARGLFIRFIEEFAKATGAEKLSGENAPEVLRFASERVARVWPGVLEKYGQALENYFVNYVFSACFPFSYHAEELTPYQHAILLAEQYALTRLVLCVCAGEDGVVDDDLLVTAFAAMAHSTLHSKDAKNMAAAYQKAGSDSLALISYLLR